MPNSADPAPSLAASLRPLMQSDQAELTLSQVVEQVESDNGLGPVIFVLTLPVLMPLPPGVSMVLALPLLLVSAQSAIGRRCMWLPKGLAGKTVKHKALAKLLGRVLPILERVEKAVRPRLAFLTGAIGARVVGVACTVIALVLVLPIPFANLAPAVAIGVLSLGLTRRDGLMILAGYGVMALAVVIITLGVHGAGLGIGHLKSMF